MRDHVASGPRRRHGAAVLLVALALAVAACTPLPKPFKPPPQSAENPLVAEAAHYGVRVEPVDGTSVPMARLLAESVAAGFKLYGIRATAESARPARFRLQGKAEINDTDPAIPYVMLIRWSLYDAGGKLIGMETQGVPGSRQEWEYGSPAVIDAVGVTAPELIATLMDEDADEMESVVPKLAGVWIEPVENAPGDGNRSLTRAIAAAIKGGGIPIAAEPRFAEFVLAGRVTVGPPGGGVQRVEIVWAVTTPDGRGIGKATQKNLVKTGTFDGRWGAAAEEVAGAALPGIAGVLRAAGATRFGLAETKKVLKLDIPGDPDAIVLPPPTFDIQVGGQSIKSR